MMLMALMAIGVFCYSQTDAYAFRHVVFSLIQRLMLMPFGMWCFRLFSDGCLCLAASLTSSAMRRLNAYGLAAIFFPALEPLRT